MNLYLTREGSFGSLRLILEVSGMQWFVITLDSEIEDPNVPGIYGHGGLVDIAPFPTADFGPIVAIKEEE